MNEQALRAEIEAVRQGALPRREFVARLAGLGLSAPMAGLLLLHAGVAPAQGSFQYKPTRRGGGGVLKMIRHDAPTLLNPHFATGLKDNFASRIFYEPLAEWDNDGNLLPVLAAEIPSVANGGLSPDGRRVTWKLKRGVTWHDGKPFTADDVIFNWQYAIDPATGAITSGNFRDLTLEKVDSHTVRVVFAKPSPFWPGLYAGMMLIPKHRFADFMGAKSRDARENLQPVGTGPYVFNEFRPADFLRADINPNYHRPNRPHFDRIELTGGGESLAAARAVLQTGEYEFAAGVLADDELLRRMEAGGKGRLEYTFGSSTTALFLNATDPAREVDGERSHLRTRHPLWSDPVIRQAFALTVDRASIQQLFGRQAVVTGNWVNNPARYRSPSIATEFNLDKARKLLDAAGWRPGADGVRSHNGRRLSVLFHGSASAVVEKYMVVVKAGAEKAGFGVDLKVTSPSVFFSSDAGNTDAYGKFLSDVLTYNWTSTLPDPAGMASTFLSTEAAARSNKWIGSNIVRWQSAEYDGLYASAETELDPVKRAALFIRMNEVLAAGGHVIPLLARSSVRAVGARLRIPFSAWRADTASLSEWYRET